MAAAKPVISPAPAASSTTPKPGPRPAWLPDPAKWAPAFETRTSLPAGANAEWTDQGIHLKATIHLSSSIATDDAVRARIRPGARNTNLGLRNTGSDAIVAGVDAGRSLVLLDRKRGQEFFHMGEFNYEPPPGTQKEILLEFVAVGKVLLISVDGKVIGSLMDDDEPVGGKFSAYSTDGYVRDLAWQSLDQPVVATIAPSPPAPPPAPVEPPKTETNDPVGPTP